VAGVGPALNLAFRLIFGVCFALFTGFIAGLIAGLIKLLYAEAVEIRISPNQGTRRSLMFALSSFRRADLRSDRLVDVEL
jgi:uncharacterized protein involved in cysteine biosynthesis